MTSRMFELTAVSLAALAAILSATAAVLMIVDRPGAGGSTALPDIDAVVRIRAQGEAREFDARVGALRIVSSGENHELGRAIAGIEAIRRIEDETGRNAHTEAAMAIGFEEARASVASGERASGRLDVALVGGAGLGALAACVLTVAASRRRSNDRRRIATGLGLDAGSEESELFADQVLLEWIRRSAGPNGGAPVRENDQVDRPRLTVVDAERNLAAPPDDGFSSSFGPTRRR